ncbi:MAG TPA: c-type cytochrome [Anaerolineales bacterium]|nr:c-type cytochrome [Anaerolineales bacterium]
MKKFLKWAGIIFTSFAGIILIALAIIYFVSDARLKKIYHVPDDAVVIPTDEASIARGKHIFQFRGCEACHSGGGFVEVSTEQANPLVHSNVSPQDIPRMEGNIYLDNPAIGRVVASNLTPGLGGVGSKYSDADWIRVIRHGVRPDGTPLVFMPSTEFYYLSDEDLGDVIAYIKSALPVDHVLPPSSISLTGRVVMTLVPSITFIPAELIPHNAPRPIAPAPGMTVQYGEYLTLSCKVCHGPTMSGGAIPGFPSSWPPAPNLTWGNGSVLPTWTEDGFIQTIRTGVTPQGVKINPSYMPWGSYKHMNDDELHAVWMYLKSLPPKASGNR